MLSPDVSVREGKSTVALHIPHSIFKTDRLLAKRNYTVHRMLHTVNHMPALHSGNKGKWSHNIIPGLFKFSKTQDGFDKDFFSVAVCIRCFKS